MAISTQKIGQLAAVIVTYNRLEKLQITLDRVCAEPCDAVVVVDNGSTDGTRDWLAGLSDPRIHLVLSDENLGGAGGFERGLQDAVKCTAAQWFVVMDDDARPYQGAFARFADMGQGAWDMLVSAVYYPDGVICEMNRPSRNPFWSLGAFLKTSVMTFFGKGREGFHINDVAYATEQVVPVDAGSFVGMFISRKVLESIGFPDGRLFIYGDDVSFSLRARKAGHSIGFAPQIMFEHDCTTFETKKVYLPYWKIYYNYRNGLITYKQAAGPWFWAALPFFLLKWAGKARHYGADKAVFKRLLWCAIQDGLAGRVDVSHQDVLRLADAKAPEHIKEP